MRPTFEYDPVRGALLVRLEVGEAFGARLFAVRGAHCPSDYVRVAQGEEPPLYCPAIKDGELFAMISRSITAGMTER